VKTQLFKRLELIIAIVGTIASTAGLIASVALLLDFRNEILASFVGVLVGVAAGYYSSYLSESFRKLNFGKRAFVSYQRPGEPYVRKLTESLREAGTKVWISRGRLKPGDSWEKEIRTAIDDADSVIVMLGKDVSKNTLYEIKVAKEKGKRIIPILIEGAELPSDLFGIEYVDLRENAEEGIRAVVEAVR
jgi:TIR domain